MAVRSPAGTLRSYVRFSPVDIDTATLAARASNLDAVRGKVALVCGGTRGLGADISAALALAGYRVYASFHRDRAAGAELASRLSSHGAAVELLEGDAGDRAWCQHTVDSIVERDGHLDLLVLNAMRASGTAADARGVGRSVHGLHAGEPALSSKHRSRPAAAALHSSRGTVAYISSSFVEDTHRPALLTTSPLKLAGENLVRAVAADSGQIAALVLRPPRLRTSWNDTPTGVLGTIPSNWVASHLVDRLADSREAGSVALLCRVSALEGRSTIR
jgi:NAD(P)-dependent dehydrogenase (short-subunit alcohol dehydrogenase family)